MTKNKLFKFLGLGVIVAFVAVVGVVLPGISNNDSKTPTVEVQEEIGQSISLTFDLGEEVKNYKAVEIYQNEFLADVLIRFTDKNNIEFSYQDYGGDLGLFIKSIHGVGDEGSSKWWQYWVNDEFSQVGVSGYKVKSTDKIVFKFAESQF